MPLTRISLTLSRYPSLSFIALGRSSGLHHVSSHNCCMYVRAGRPAFAWPYAGVHRRTSLMSSSLLLQQCPMCLARLTCIVFVMGGKKSYIKYIWFVFFCISTILFLYIKYMISKHILLIRYFNEPDLFFFCTQLNSFIFFYHIRIILFIINHFLVHCLMFSSIAMYH